MDFLDIYVIMWGFGIGFIAWLFGKVLRFFAGATSSPEYMKF